jgi:hypothetical protein
MVVSMFVETCEIYFFHVLRKNDHVPPLMPFFRNLIFVYSKSEYTLESVSVSGRPSVYTIIPERLNPIDVKFCTQYYLIKISVEFEDEQNSSRIY